MAGKFLIFMVVLLAIIPFSLTANEPVAKQAVQTQELRGGEVELQATGIFTSAEKSKSKMKKDIEKNGARLATEDARRSAIYSVLFSGQNPIIASTESRMMFNSRGAFVYEPQNMNRYISFEEKKLSHSEVTNDGKTMKVSLIIRINKPQLIRELRNNGILQDASVFDELDKNSKSVNSEFRIENSDFKPVGF